MDPVIGLCLTRGPSSFFRRVGAVPSTIIISQNDTATTKDLWKRSLSFSRGIVLAETRPLYRGQSDFEWPQVHTSLDPSIVWLFFFFGRKPDQNPDVESIDCLAVAIYRVINLSGRIYLVENICNASLFDDRVDPRKRKRFFFLIWRLLDSNIESISDSFTGSIPLLRFIEAWLIHRMNLSSLTFMLIAGNARDFCRCVSLSFR